jgi:hypothetical protein
MCESCPGTRDSTRYRHVDHNLHTHADGAAVSCNHSAFVNRARPAQASSRHDSMQILGTGVWKKHAVRTLTCQTPCRAASKAARRAQVPLICVSTCPIAKEIASRSCQASSNVQTRTINPLTTITPPAGATTPVFKNEGEVLRRRRFFSGPRPINPRGARSTPRKTFVIKHKQEPKPNRPGQPPFPAFPVPPQTINPPRGQKYSQADFCDQQK